MNNNKEGSVVSRSGRRGTGPGSVVDSGDSGGSWFGALTGLFFADDRFVPSQSTGPPIPFFDSP